MEFLKKRGGAIGVFVAVAVVFSLLGCHRSLSKECRRAEAMFFDHAAFAEDNYYSSPAEQLDNCVKYANRLLSLISGSDELTEAYAAIRDSRAALDEALADGDISDIHDAADALLEAVTAMDGQVQAGATLSDSSDDYDTVLADFLAAADEAEQSPYNDYVDDFIRETVRPFPTNLLRLASFVRLPEKYE